MHAAHHLSLTLLLALFTSANLLAQLDYADSPLKYGPHAVGFEYTKTVDRSRVYRRVNDYSDRL